MVFGIHLLEIEKQVMLVLLLKPSKNMKHDIILLSFHLPYFIQNLNTYKNDLWANTRNLYQFHLNALFCISGQYF